MLFYESNKLTHVPHICQFIYLVISQEAFVCLCFSGGSCFHQKQTSRKSLPLKRLPKMRKQSLLMSLLRIQRWEKFCVTETASVHFCHLEVYSAAITQQTAPHQLSHALISVWPTNKSRAFSIQVSRQWRLVLPSICLFHWYKFPKRRDMKYYFDDKLFKVV